jgi:hypothetical protein
MRIEMRNTLISGIRSFGIITGIVATMTIPCTSTIAQSAVPYDTGQVGTRFVAIRSIPEGTPIQVIVLTPVSSAGSQPGDTIKVKIAPDDASGVPKSIVFIGHVREAIPASNSQPGVLSLHFDALAPTGHWQLDADAPPATDYGGPAPIEEASGRFVGSSATSGGRSDVGIGAAAGAIIGGSRKEKLGDIIEGGLLGALGGYAVQKATTHSANDITLKSGQEVTITLRHPITVKTELIAD